MLQFKSKLGAGHTCYGQKEDHKLYAKCGFISKMWVHNVHYYCLPANN
jgi:hypothetical protein